MGMVSRSGRRRPNASSGSEGSRRLSGLGAAGIPARFWRLPLASGWGATCRVFARLTLVSHVRVHEDCERDGRARKAELKAPHVMPSETATVTTGLDSLERQAPMSELCPAAGPGLPTRYSAARDAPCSSRTMRGRCGDRRQSNAQQGALRCDPGSTRHGQTKRASCPGGDRRIPRRPGGHRDHLALSVAGSDARPGDQCAKNRAEYRRSILLTRARSRRREGGRECTADALAPLAGRRN